MKKNNIFFDTCFLIWAIRGDAPKNESEQEMKESALALLKKLKDENAKDQYNFCISTISYSELLILVPVEKQARLAEILTKMFTVVEFGLKQAEMCSRVIPKSFSGQASKCRSCIKADGYIASSVYSKMSQKQIDSPVMDDKPILYTFDSDFNKVKLLFNVVDPRDIELQLDSHLGAREVVSL